MSHPVEMTQHPLRSPTPSNEPKDLDQEISQKLKILDFVTLVLSHPSMMQAVREMATKELETATKELETATKRTMNPIDPSMPGTSTSSTDTHGLHVSTGTPITVSQKDLLTSLATSLQPPIARSSQNTQQTLMSMTLLTGRAFTMPCRQTKKNWHDSQKEKVIQKRKMKKEKGQSEKKSKSPKSKKPDLQVALAHDEIFGTLLGETTTAVSKLKTE